MDNFNTYAKYYDLLYKDKDYHAEVDYVNQLIQENSNGTFKSVLDIGCGTGIHANLMSEHGYTVDGIDMSAQMIEKARSNYSNNTNINFYLGDSCTYRNGKQYDVVTSLFHVMSYQNSNEALIDSFKTAFTHLKKGGVFIFDFWYGPAVLTDLPTNRLKELSNKEMLVSRKAIPEIHFNENVVDVNYEIDINFLASENREIIKEKHSMRYFFKPELSYFLKECGLELIEMYEWLTDNAPDQNSWNAVIVCKK